MGSENIVHIEGNNWQSEVMEAKTPVLVDFWAEWCAPCLMIAPVLEELAGELSGKIKIAKVNVDHNQQIASQYGIRSIPTLLLVKNGSVEAQMVGAMGKAALKAKLEPHLQDG